MHDVGEAVATVRVEDAQQPAVVDGRGEPGRLHQVGGPLVVLGQAVQGDVALEHPVVRAPEPAVAALGEQVDQPVAVGEHVPRSG